MVDKVAVSDFWFISHTGDIKHCCKVEAGQHLTTSQETYEEFNSEEDYIARCEELSICLDS